MLEYLSISNLAVISDVEIEFGPGLNVITGETGAGKSMIVQALEMLRGGRASSQWIRTGQDNAKVGATITQGADILSRFEDFCDENGEEIIIERTLTAQGRSRVRIQGALSNIQTLAELTGELIELTSQHDHQKLLSSASYISMVDSMISQNDVFEKLRMSYESLEKAARNLDDLKQKLTNRSSRMENLEFLLEELRGVSPKVGEYENLLKLRRKLASMQDIISTSLWAEELLYSGDSSVSGSLFEIIRKARALSKSEPQMEQVSDILEEARTLCTEAAGVFRNLGEFEDADADPDFVEARLHSYEKLIRKHGVEDADKLISVMQTLEDEFATLNEVSFGVEKLEKQVLSLRKETAELCNKLTELRLKAATDLEKRVSQELGHLGFTGAVFHIEIVPKKAPVNTEDWKLFNGLFMTATGSDKASFLFSANPGLALRPVSESASGGEISRIHLAIKCACVSSSPQLTSIYDEVDAGIGGTTANAVGLKLKTVALKRQIICITHLPQIAAFADHHFVVSKEIVNGSTNTTVRALTLDERIKEIARMMGGVSPESLNLAEKMIKNSDT